jgi:hypothetical protein
MKRIVLEIIFDLFLILINVNVEPNEEEHERII